LTSLTTRRSLTIERMAFLPVPRSVLLLSTSSRHRVYLGPARVALRARRLRAFVPACSATIPGHSASTDTHASQVSPSFPMTPSSPAASLTNSKSNYSKSSPLAPPPPQLRGDGAQPMETRYDPAAIENLIYEWWESAGYFSPDSGTSSASSDEKPFVVCMPPPNVTGDLHMGHAMFVAVEDILVRHARMLGKPALYLPGKDHAGIATQLVVAKQLAKDGVDYRQLDRDVFLKHIWDWKHAKHDYISKQLRKLGASCDWTRERFTLDDQMCRSVNEAFVTLHQRGLIYRGDYMVNWSPGLQTAVSDVEVEFSEEMAKLYYFKYPLEGGGHIPIATTRPETILGDTALCVHPEDERYKHLIGKKAVVPMVGRTIEIIGDEYVKREFGTGALKITPGHDTNDYELGKKHRLEIVNIMNRDATLNENAGEFNGMDRFDARKAVWKKLEELHLADKVEDHQSRVPRSQRGGEIVEPLVSTQWFVKMDGLAKRALDAVQEKQVRIVPERFEKIYNNWLENIRDWCVSRQLVWGHRIPVWNVVEQPGEYVVARGEAEARELALEKYGKVTLVQETDVLDTWFSSGLWPFATMGWPDKSDAVNDLSRFFPGSVLETGYDILFFWVARMIMLSLELTGKVPFETVYLHGLVNDAQGKKMSKSVGNVIDPLNIIGEYGTDALRYSLVTGSTPGQDIPLSVERIESNRNFANKLWNACRFIISNLDNIDEEERNQLATIAISDFGTRALDPQSEMSLPERATISRLHGVVASVSHDLETFQFGDAGRQIYEFLWDVFAAWYVEIAKSRLYATDMDSNSESVAAALTTRATLVYVVDICLRILHPLMPFVTEALWQRLPRSKHGEGEQALIIAKWPTKAPRDLDAEERFDRIQAFVRSVRNARAEYDVVPSNRIPAVVYADATAAKDIEGEKGAIATLAKINPENFEVHLESNGTDTEAETPGDQFLNIRVDAGLRVVIPLADLIDYEKERKRLEKQIAKLEKDREGLSRRLGAAGFREKAPENVVRTAVENKEKIEEVLQGLNERLATVIEMAG